MLIAEDVDTAGKKGPGDTKMFNVQTFLKAIQMQSPLKVPPLCHSSGA
jgi:hypothetical protein